MDMDKDLAITLGSLTVVIATLIGGITHYNIEQDKLVAEAISGGAAPLEAKCAYSNGMVCYTIAAKQLTQSK